ncbi:MAG: GAF domain-containing protein, partial [Phycisphaerales bacterium]|nr:GAF domain-containing protein [Phycisphaerales bacterium]
MADSRPTLYIVGAGEMPPDLGSSLSRDFDLRLVREASEVPAGARAIEIRSGDALTSDRADRLLNAIGEGVVLASPDGEITWANNLFRNFEDELHQRVAQRCREAAGWFSERAIGPQDHATSPTCKYEITIGDEDRYFDFFVSPLETDGEGRLSLIVGVVRDVTRGRRFRRRIDAIDRAGSELVRIDSEIIRDLNAMERLRFLENKIIRYCHDLLHFDNFAIRILDERSNKLEVVIATGLPDEVQNLDIFPEPDDNGICGYVAHTGRSYICHDTEHDTRFLPGMDGARSSLTVPLQVHDKIIGVLDVESSTPSAFTEEDRQVAEIFARYIALALHMLDLLVAERSTTNLSVSDRVEDELSEPLADIVREAQLLNEVASKDPEAARHVSRIFEDVDAIRRRVGHVATGAQTLPGVEEALTRRSKDPVLVDRIVLIADDESRVRRVIGDILRNRGATVIIAPNGSEAIKALETEGSSFDL